MISNPYKSVFFNKDEVLDKILKTILDNFSNTSKKIIYNFFIYTYCQKSLLLCLYIQTPLIVLLKDS